MKTNSVFLARKSIVLSIGVALIASILSCNRDYKPKDIEVTSKTRYSGSINGSPVSIDVLATINTGRGGRSTCTVTGPSGFNAAVLGTMA